MKPIPNINIGQVYDQRYSDAEVHYDKLGNLAGFFGRNMPVHRHDRFFQVHYVKSGAVRVYLDDRQFVVDVAVTGWFRYRHEKTRIERSRLLDGTRERLDDFR